jgi:hypothetical protein
MRSLLLVLLLSVFSPVHAKEDLAPPAGLKVLSAGHSFHVWMPPLVAEMAKAVKEQRGFDFGVRDELIDCFCGE